MVKDRWDWQAVSIEGEILERGRRRGGHQGPDSHGAQRQSG